MRSTSFYRHSLVVGFLFLVPQIAWADLRVVATSADLDPRTGELFLEFSAPVINSDGEVAFSADLDDPNASFGIWSEGDGVGSLINVVLNGDSAPGVASAKFYTFSSPFITGQGDVVFRGFLDDFVSEGLWTDRDRPGTALTKIVADGDPVPGAPGETFQTGQFLVNTRGGDSGVAFESNGSITGQGIFSEDPVGTLTKVVQRTEAAPGTVGVFDNVGIPMTNDLGHVVFFGDTNLAAAGAAGIWTTSPSGTLREVAVALDPADGTSTTFSILFRDRPTINNDGDIAFMATLTGLISGSLREGIWVERGGTIDKVVFESEAAPGTGSTFDNLDSSPLLDGDGNTLFHAILADSTSGLWLDKPGSAPEAIALEGQAAPGTSGNFLDFSRMSINESGQIAFVGGTDDPNVTEALYATDPNGTITKIVATGDLIEIGGTTYSVDVFSFAGLTGPFSGNSLASGLSDTGEVAFEAALFDPNSGDELYTVLVSDLVKDGSDDADFNEDGWVTGLDFLRWQVGYDPNCTSCTLGDGDADGDMDVDHDDLAIWESQNGMAAPTVASVSTVPEPTAALLLCLGCLLGGRRWR